MAIVPSLILMLTAITIAFLRDRGTRLVQGSGLLGILIAGAFLFVAAGAESAPSSPAERPFAESFRLEVAFQFRSEIWPVATLAIALLLAAMIDDLGRNSRPSAMAMALGALAIAASLAANLQTVVVTWTMIAALQSIAWLRSAVGERSLAGLFAYLGSQFVVLLALMASAYVNAKAGGSGSLAEPVRGGSSAILLLLAVLVQSRISGIPGPGSDREEQASSGGELAPLLVAAAAVAVLGGQTTAWVIRGVWRWYQAIGVVGLVWGVFGITLVQSPQFRRANLRLSIASFGVLAASMISPLDSAAIVGSAGLIVVVGGIAALAKVRQKWQLAWPVIAGLMTSGIPGTPGNALLQALSRGVNDLPSAAIFGVALFGAAVICAALWTEGVDLPSGEPAHASARLLASDLGLLALMLVVGMVSVDQGWLGDAKSSILWVLVLIASGALTVMERRWALVLKLRDRLAPVMGFRIWLGHLARTLLDVIAGAVRALAGVFEGRGAVLWMFLAVLIAVLAIQAGSP